MDVLAWKKLHERCGNSQHLPQGEPGQELLYCNMEVAL